MGIYHRGRDAGLDDCGDVLVGCAAQLLNAKARERNMMYRRNDDLSDLPPELLKELSESFKGETDPLIRIINDRGGTASLDEILVDLFRRYREIGKRPIISNKLYRFSKRGLCAPVPGKKGFYTTDPDNG